MKKYFQIVGIITLACFSFVFTERTALLVRDNDTLMQVIKEQSDNYIIDSINASVNEDTIIPGINGKRVNNNKSYNNMKRLGEFNENLLIYDLILPEVTLTNTYDKYVIGGNPNKNMVSIIFKVDKNSKIRELLNIIRKEEKYNFFVDGVWLEENEDILKEIASYDYNIGNSSYGGNYLNSGYAWIDSIINKYSGQKNRYCYMEEKNEKYLEVCKYQKSYTIIPSIVVEKEPLIEIKEKLSSGDIISLDINDKVIKEMPLIVNYIKSKGYKLVSLDELLSEAI